MSFGGGKGFYWVKSKSEACNPFGTGPHQTHSGPMLVGVHDIFLLKDLSPSNFILSLIFVSTLTKKFHPDQTAQQPNFKTDT